MVVRLERICYKLCDMTEDTNLTQRSPSPFTKHTQAGSWKVFMKLKVMQLSKGGPCGELSNSVESKSSFVRRVGFLIAFLAPLAERWGNLPRVSGP